MGCIGAFTVKKRLQWRSTGRHSHIRFRRSRRNSLSNRQNNLQISQTSLPQDSDNQTSNTSPATRRQQAHQPQQENDIISTAEEAVLPSSVTPQPTEEQQVQAAPNPKTPTHLATIRQAITKLLKRTFKKVMPEAIITGTSTAWNALHFGKSGIAISLSSEAQTYSTLDAISGHVTVQPKSDIHFDNLEISMTGVTRIFVDKLSHSSTVTGRSEATHRFLKLAQPIHDLPVPQVFEAGKTYKFPFTFVVPANLLPRACSHDLVSNHIREYHLALPPSVGDKGVDDLAPEHTKIRYAIEAKITKYKEDGKKVSLGESSQKIRIRPTSDEHPPLTVEDNKTYCLRRDKMIRKGLLKAKTGCLVMEASQPRSFQLPAVDEEQSASTHVLVMLRFDPATENSKPPRLSSLSSKLRVSNFFATTCRPDFPHKSNQNTDLTCDSTNQAFSLSSYTIPAVDWTKHTSSSGQHALRPESALSSISTISGVSCAGGVLAPSQCYRDSVFYTAQVIVPLSLPSKNTFLPTFHSCLMSRTYALHLSLYLDGQRFSAPLTLKLPVQVLARGSAAGMERQRLANVAEQAIADAEAAFAPRYVTPSMAVEDVDVGRVDTTLFPDMPPGYDAPGFAMAGVRGLRVYG